MWHPPHEGEFFVWFIFLQHKSSVNHHALIRNVLITKEKTTTFSGRATSECTCFQFLSQNKHGGVLNNTTAHATKPKHAQTIINMRRLPTEFRVFFVAVANGREKNKTKPKSWPEKALLLWNTNATPARGREKWIELRWPGSNTVIGLRLAPLFHTKQARAAGKVLSRCHCFFSISKVFFSFYRPTSHLIVS